MKRKILLSLLTGIILTSMIGCNKEGTSDVNSDTVIVEKNLKNSSTETSKSTKESKKEKDTTKVKIKEAYLTEKYGRNYVILRLDTVGNFDYTTKAIIKGISGNTEVVLNDSSIEKTICDYFKPTINDVEIPFKQSDTDKFMFFRVDSTDYESYSITIAECTEVDEEPGEIIKSSEYKIKSSEIEEIDYKDLVYKRLEDMFNNTKESNIAKFDGFEVEYLDFNFREEDYTISIRVKNTGKEINEEMPLVLQITSKDNVGVQLFEGENKLPTIPPLNPGEETIIQLEYKLRGSESKFQPEDGEEFILYQFLNYKELQYTKIKYEK